MVWQWIETHPVLAGMFAAIATTLIGGWFKLKGTASRAAAAAREDQRKDHEWLYSQMRQRTHDLRDELQAMKGQLEVFREQRDFTVKRLREVEEQLRDRDRKMEQMQSQLDERDRKIISLQAQINQLTRNQAGE